MISTYLVKIVLTTLLVILATEISKSDSILGSLITSLPLVSILVFFWIYKDTGSAEKVADLSINIFWMVLPSLVLFILLPILLKKGITFIPSITISMACTIVVYFGMFKLLRYYEIVQS